MVKLGILKPWRWLRASSARHKGKAKEMAPAAETPSAAETAGDPMSPLGRKLARAIRRAMLRGEGDRLLSEYRVPLKRWHAEQSALAQSALGRVQATGLPIERALSDAVESAALRRTTLHAKKRDFFEDSEALVRSISAYSGAFRAQHDAREALRQARERLSLLENPSSDVLREAEEAVRQAKWAVGTQKRREQDAALVDARLAMVAARALMEQDYYVARFGPFETCPPAVYTAGAGQERASDSNRVQLRPRLSGSIGRR